MTAEAWAGLVFGGLITLGVWVTLWLLLWLGLRLFNRGNRFA